jgi:two-component system NtrC family sensor kinase
VRTQGFHDQAVVSQRVNWKILAPVTVTKNSLDRWFAWRTLFAVSVAVVLAALGVENIVKHASAREVEDGVLWADRAEGVTAIDIAPHSPGADAGIRPGDVLIAVDREPVRTHADVIDIQHRGQEGSRLSYLLLRLGSQEAIEVSLATVPGGSSMYFVLASVGLFTLLVGAAVRVRRPRDQATLHFFWLCVAFFGAFTFSFNGPLDRLDWVFYWGDAIATAALAPLLLHFVLAFPRRESSEQRSGIVFPTLPLLYLPAATLGTIRVLTLARPAADLAATARIVDWLDRAQHGYLFVCASIALVVLVRAFREPIPETARRQLRWMAWGTALGAAPFALGYALPWALGFNPPFALQLTAIPLGLVPLAFASAIVRYRLRDVEVIVKSTLAYGAFLVSSVLFYLAVRRLIGFLFTEDRDPRNWIVALLTTVVVVLILKPVKEAVRNALDRLFYRDRYDYRRALVGFTRDLNADLDVVRLSQRLVSRVVETLLVDRMALMLADERSHDFGAIGDFGFPGPVPKLSRTSSFLARLDGGHTIALDDPIVAARFAAEEVEFWRDAGVYYFVPCVFEGHAIAVFALGRKEADEPFNSEDLALLTAVAGQAATSIENGRLYRQLHIKAEELDGLREFNENILESLDDGLVVFDHDERIVRWNRALEAFYGITRTGAIGCKLSDVFETPFVEALRAELRENPEGSALFRVPLNGRKGETAQLLVNATVVPLQESASDEAGVAGTILLIENITDRVRLVEQLQLSEKMASIGVLAAGVAHEVNTPLTGISSYTQMLLESAAPDDPRTALLEKIERQTFRAAKIVNGLLNLARPGTAGGERTVVDLNNVINDVFSLLEHQFASAKVKVRRELWPNTVEVLGVEHQLQQVFLNLFLNARDAMPRGGWLSVATRADGDRIVAEVSDTGSGIPSEHLARIYDPFFTTKAIGRGTGLGLSITYGIVHEHGGTIGCESALGQGTRFTLRLPAAALEPVSRAQG